MSAKQRRSPKQKPASPATPSKPAAQKEDANKPQEEQTINIPIQIKEKPRPTSAPEVKSADREMPNGDGAHSDGDGGASKKAPSKAQLALKLKEEANAKYKAENYVEAIDLYSKAIELDPRNHLLLSNRSLARYKYAKSLAAKGETTLGETTKLYQASLEDALACIDLKPDFPKGYLRAGQALKAMGQIDAALQLYEASLARFPNEQILIQERDETKKASDQSRDEFPLSTQFLLNMLGSPPVQRHPNEPKPSEAEAELTPSERDRLLRSLFGSRYGLVPHNAPKSQWTFFYGDPPNRRSATNWRPQEETPPPQKTTRRPSEFDAMFDDPHAAAYPHIHAHAHPHLHNAAHSFSPNFNPQGLPPQWRRQHVPHAHSASIYDAPPAYPRHPTQPSSPSNRDWADLWQFDLDQAGNGPTGMTTTSATSSSIPSQQPPRGIKRARFTHPTTGTGGGHSSSELRELCDQLRVSQYYPELQRQGVETIDDLVNLPNDFVQQLFPTLGHQARVMEFIRRNRA